MKKQPVNPRLPGRLGRMTAEELDADVAQFDQEFIADQARPLTPAMRKRWQQTQRSPGRPRVGKGAKRVLVSIEQGLLERADALAKSRHMTRSALFSRGVREMLAKAS